MISPRSYSTEPPPLRTFEHNKPTLLVSWWCTGFALTIIVFRLAGRYIRIEHLFREDKIMALAIMPILFRMGLVHVVLLWGTNNTVTTGLSREAIYQREIGSRLVLVSRIMYAAVLWTLKYSIAETLYRLLSQAWSSSYERAVRVLRWFLLFTFLGVAVSAIGECQPFTHYWQVVPDPGPKCRLGYAQLATMGTANIITDLLLVALPIPIIVRSSMTTKRKISLVLLFGLSLAPVAVTIYRIPTLVDRRGSQQFRSLCASLEILVATGSANALALGSFVRDRGPKKMKFKFGSGSSSASRPSSRPEGRMPHWDSDEDLVRSYGMNPDPERGSVETTQRPRPAPLGVPEPVQMAQPQEWQLPSHTMVGNDMDLPYPARSGSSAEGSLITPRRVTFFDVGGLLEDDSRRRSSSASPIIDLYAEPSVAGAPDDEISSPQPGSRAFVRDLGGIIPRPLSSLEVLPAASPHHSAAVRPASKTYSGKAVPDSTVPARTRSSKISNLRLSQSRPSPSSRLSQSPKIDFQDVGGLLSRTSDNPPPLR